MSDNYQKSIRLISPLKMEKTETSCDIEILSLIIGLGRTSKITQISEDSIQKMLGKLRPEKLKFSYFIKDCVLQIVNKIGPVAASKKLEVSVPVLKSIVKYSNISLKTLKPPELPPKKPPQNFNENKQKILDFYQDCKSISKTAKHFKISKEKTISCIVSCTESFE